MKFTIGQTPKSPEKPIQIWLETSGPDVMVHVAKPGIVEINTILCIRPDGTFSRVPCVRGELGFDVDSRRRIKEVPYE